MLIIQGEKNMGIYEELQARGLIAQVTDEEVVRELVNNGKATFYIGFDPTADSLHVGHFMALCLMKRLQMAGNKPIALIGGGTAMIGDPSGRSDMRSMMTKEMIDDVFDKSIEFAHIVLCAVMPEIDICTSVKSNNCVFVTVCW